MFARCVLLFACLAFVLLIPPDANAACWRLPSGQIVETQSNSTPPVRRAVLVRCPTPTISPAPEPIRTFDQRSDDRECVDYARSRVRNLPSGLFTMADKRAIINSNEPRAGSIAIIEVRGGQYRDVGHVAYVETVTRNSITISETNFGGRRFQQRTSTASTLREAERQLNIVGYFRP
jgi:hypothetical protein